jgi:hypothetical protein
MTSTLHKLLAAVTDNPVPVDEPVTLHQALSGPHSEQWKEAVFQELDTLGARDTYTLEELPTSKKAIGVKWVFKVKLNGEGEVERFKARMVARGFTQVEGQDYNETYAPVSRFTTVRCLMAVKALTGLPLIQLDVGNAFLYGEMGDQELFMKQPPGFEDGTGRVCKLIKSLYGLKQAPKIWYEKLGATLAAAGFTRSSNDWALYYKQGEEGRVWVLLYVDDILILGHGAAAEAAALTLSLAYKCKREDGSKYLGINLTHTAAGGTYMSLKKYGRELEELATDLPVAHNPIQVDPIHPQPSRVTAADLHPVRQSKGELKLYQKKVGKLMFAATTIRADLSLAVGKLAQGSRGPNRIHLEQVDRALSFMYNSRELSMGYTAEGEAPSVLVGACDADYSRNVYQEGTSASDEVIHATSGYVFSLAGGLISWGSKKQSAPVLSAMEAELVAAVSAATEAAYLRRLLSDLGVRQVPPTVLRTDSASLVALMTNQGRLQRSKHAPRLHWLRHAQDSGIIKLIWIPREQNPADFLTRVTTRKEFEHQSRLCGFGAVGNRETHPRNGHGLLHKFSVGGGQDLLEVSMGNEAAKGLPGHDPNHYPAH